jgi:hypothetical protein
MGHHGQALVPTAPDQPFTQEKTLKAESRYVSNMGSNIEIVVAYFRI